jgi:hypothetical protein
MAQAVAVVIGSWRILSHPGKTRLRYSDAKEFIMGILVNWVANQGLSLGQDLFIEMLGLPSFEARVSEELERINQKLDILIEAPFRQARMHYLEGNIDKAKERLIEAISLNEFDLPSKAMYCRLLCESGNLALAVDYFEEIVRQFGPHVEAVPKSICNFYARYLVEERPLRATPQFSVDLGRRDSYYYRPVIIVCTLSCIVVRWESGSRPAWVGGTYTGGHSLLPKVTVYDWSGKLVMEAYANYSTMLAVSEEYLVIAKEVGFFSRSKIEVFRTRDGSRVALPHPLSAAHVAELFYPDQRFSFHVKSEWPSPSFDFTFSGARVRSPVADRGIISFAPE